MSRKVEGKTGLRRTYYAPDGSTYVGEWKDGKREGRGTYTYPNGDYYEGEWKENKFDGFGRMFINVTPPKVLPRRLNVKKSVPVRLKHELRYEGNWEKGEKSGFGVYFYQNGERYEGHFANDVREGYGVLFYPAKRKEPGQEEPANFGVQYRGLWKGDVRDGKGLLLFPNGDIFMGEFHDNERQGPGTYLYAKTRRRLEGVWENGVCKAGEYTAWSIDNEIDVLHIWTDEDYPWPGLEPHVVDQLREMLSLADKDGKQPTTLSFSPEEFPFAPPTNQDSIAVDLRLPVEPPMRPIPVLMLKNKDDVISEVYQQIIGRLLSDSQKNEE